MKFPKSNPVNPAEIVELDEQFDGGVSHLAELTEFQREYEDDWRRRMADMHLGRVPSGCRDLWITVVRRIRNHVTADVQRIPDMRNAPHG